MTSLRGELFRRAFGRVMELRRRRGGPAEVEGETEDERYARSVLELRERFDRLAQRTRVPGDATATPAASPVPGQWVTAEGAEPDRVVLHLHGGAFVLGSSTSHLRLGARLSRHGRARVLLPDYRLAPEHRFPAAVEDALGVYRWLVGPAGIDPARVVVSGDSAGGGLALALLVALRDAGDPLPAGYVGMSPWVDLTVSGDSIVGRADRDPWLVGDQVLPSARGYAGGAPLDHPWLSPLFADLRGLPPMLVHAGSEEVLHDDATRLVARARQAGIDASVVVFEGMWHVFQAFAVVPEARRSLREIGGFVRRVTSPRGLVG